MRLNSLALFGEILLVCFLVFEVLCIGSLFLCKSLFLGAFCGKICRLLFNSLLFGTLFALCVSLCCLCSGKVGLCLLVKCVSLFYKRLALICPSALDFLLRKTCKRCGVKSLAALTLLFLLLLLLGKSLFLLFGKLLLVVLYADLTGSYRLGLCNKLFLGVLFA